MVDRKQGYSPMMSQRPVITLKRKSTKKTNPNDVTLGESKQWDEPSSQVPTIFKYMYDQPPPNQQNCQGKEIILKKKTRRPVLSRQIHITD